MKEPNNEYTHTMSTW